MLNYNVLCSICYCVNTVHIDGIDCNAVKYYMGQYLEKAVGNWYGLEQEENQ